MDTIPEIIQSMKNSPDEINRKRYMVFVEQQEHIDRLTRMLRAVSGNAQSGNAHLYPSDHYGL